MSAVCRKEFEAFNEEFWTGFSEDVESMNARIDRIYQFVIRDHGIDFYVQTISGDFALNFNLSKSNLSELVNSAVARAYEIIERHHGAMPREYSYICRKPNLEAGSV